MNKVVNLIELEVGYDVPSAIGMDAADIQTPCLVLDLDALERNIKKWVISPKPMVSGIVYTERCTNPLMLPGCKKRFL